MTNRHAISWQAVGSIIAAILMLVAAVSASSSRTSSLETGVADLRAQQQLTDEKAEAARSAMESIDKRLSRIEGKLGIQ